MDDEHLEDATATRRRLDEVEVRVLGCLVEKERTTPDDYPLTANALMRAANQSTSRHPVVDYDVRLVEDACASLKAEGLLRFVHMPSGRATTKYRHVLHEALSLDAGELALLGLLMLRGPQTAGELKARSERLHEFADVVRVQEALDRLASRQPALAVDLGRAPGQKETRWAHLLGEPPTSGDAEPWPGSSTAGRSRPRSDADERITRLEHELADLRAWVVELREALGLDVSGPA